MEETELQGLVELNKQFEEFRVNSLWNAEDCARHFEEQRLHNQNLERQMMEMKELLLNMAKGQQEAASAPRSPASPLNEQSESVDDYLGRFECAHHVLDEMPHSTNTIELVQIDESSEDGGEALFEVVNRIERDEDPSQILVPNEPNSAKESSDSTAHQVLDKMPSDLNRDFAAHQVLDKMPELLADKIDLADVTGVDLYHVEKQAQAVVSNDPGLMLIQGEIISNSYWDNVAEEINERLQECSQIALAEIAAQLLVGSQLIASVLESKIGTFGVSDLNHTSLSLVENMAANLVRFLRKPPNQEEIVMDYIGVLCFDPGGGFLDLVGDSFKLAIVPLESSNLWCDEELTKMTFSLSPENDPCLLKCYKRLSNQWSWSAGFVPCLLKCLLSNCVVGLTTFRHGFPSDCSSGEWIMQSQIIGCLARLIFDPGGQCSRFTKTESSVSCLLWLCNQSYELIIKSSSQEQTFCLILGDKDRLKEGVLLQDFAVEPVCPGLGYYMY